MKFRTKLTLCMLGLLSLLLGVAGSALISTSFSTALERERESAYRMYQMALQSLQLVNSASRQANYDDISGILEQLSGANAASWAGLRLYASGGTLYERGAGAIWGEKAGGSGAAPGNSSIRYVSLGEREHYLMISGAFAAGDEPLCLDVAYDISGLFTSRRNQEGIYLRVFLAMTALCALTSYALARLLTRPLERLSGASRRLAAGALESRARVSGGDEIGALAADFNHMAARIEDMVFQLRRAVERQEHFMGSFAHELKTPMTSIIGYADLIRGGTLDAGARAEAADYIVSEGKRLENLSRKLLDIQVVQRRPPVLTPTRPAALVEGFVAHMGPVYRREGIVLRCDCEEGSCLLEPDLVKSLLNNLTDNARKAMTGGGHIRIRTAMLPDGCLIRVEDDGRGIPAGALDRLTEAFYRVDKSRSREQGGVGLGLALCQEIALVHHGSIRFESREGQGTAVLVELRGGGV